MREFIFTFGCGQPHEGCYTVIQAETRGEAREEMFRRFGQKWSMQYDLREDAGVERFSLREIH